MILLTGALILLAGMVAGFAPEYPKLLFTSCVQQGWSCVNETDGLSSTISSVAYKCKEPSVETERATRINHYGGHENYYKKTVGDAENYTLTLTEWEKLPLSSITVRGCGTITLNMNTVNPPKIKTLIIEKTRELLIKPAKGECTNHPQSIALRNIENIPVLPAGFITHSNMKQFEIFNATIGSINKNAISLKAHLETFEWKNVTTLTMREKSIVVSMEDDTEFHIFGSTFPHLRSASIIVKAGKVTIEESYFQFIQEASLQITTQMLIFKNNLVDKFKGPIYILSPDVTFQGNQLRETETANLTHWTSHTTDIAPDHVSLLFIDNYVNFDRSQIETIACWSEVTYIENGADCAKLSKGPVPWSHNQQNNLTISNLVVCGNSCSSNCQLPPSWNIKNNWPKPICNSGNSTSVDTSEEN